MLHQVSHKVTCSTDSKHYPGSEKGWIKGQDGREKLAAVKNPEFTRPGIPGKSDRLTRDTQEAKSKLCSGDNERPTAIQQRLGIQDRP